MYPLVHLCIYLCILSVPIYYIHEKTHEKNNYINNQSYNLFSLCLRESCSHSSPPSRTGKPLKLPGSMKMYFLQRKNLFLTSLSTPACLWPEGFHPFSRTGCPLASKQQKFTPQMSLLSLAHAGLHLSNVFLGRVINSFYQHNILDTTTRPLPVLFSPESLDKWEFSQYFTSIISNLSSDSKSSFNKI